MAYSALPILFFNLGGEMLYVLDQRLVAQNIESNKASKVLSDIVNSMFNIDSFNEMTKPQALYSRTALKGIFKKIVHSSIMKVNADSMEKLYDLMLMSLKYQVLECNNLKELLHITLNHLDATLNYVASNRAVTEKVKTIFIKLVAMYGSLTTGQYVLLKQALLSFLQDANSKVSVYLSLNKQNNEGTFFVHTEGELPEGFDVPGKITLYKSEKNGVKVISQTFDSGVSFHTNFSSQAANISDDIFGVRCTKLGTNIYKDNRKFSDCQSSSSELKCSNESAKYAQAELQLLAQMIGSSSDESEYDFRLTLFPERKAGSDDTFAGSSKQPNTVTPRTPAKLKLPEKDKLSKSDPLLFNKSSSHNVINITPSKSGSSEINKVIEKLTIKTSSKKNTPGEDMLFFMDS